MPYCRYADIDVGIDEIDEGHQIFKDLLHGLHFSVNKSRGNTDILPLLQHTAKHIHELLEVESTHMKVHFPHRFDICNLHFENVTREVNEMVSQFEDGSFHRLEDYMVQQLHGLMHFTKEHFCIKPPLPDPETA